MKQSNYIFFFSAYPKNISAGSTTAAHQDTVTIPKSEDDETEIVSAKPEAKAVYGNPKGGDNFPPLLKEAFDKVINVMKLDGVIVNGYHVNIQRFRTDGDSIGKWLDSNVSLFI